MNISNDLRRNLRDVLDLIWSASRNSSILKIEAITINIFGGIINFSSLTIFYSLFTEFPVIIFLRLQYCDHYNSKTTILRLQ